MQCANFRGFAFPSGPSTIPPFQVRVPVVPATLAALSLALFAGCGGARTASRATAPILATYGTERLTLPDFEERYARTVGGRTAAAADSLPALEDFLRRYVDFRIKVKEAEAIGLDRNPTVQGEIADYRRNLARPYLLETEVVEPVVRLLYERQGQIVDASHVLITVGENASPADTSAAYGRILAVVDSVRNGLDFGEAARKFSQDPSAQGEGPGAKGRLGYFTGGDMVDEFEDYAYTTAPGGMSPVFRTRYGYHVMYVHDRRATPEEIRVAHILIRPEGSEPGQIEAARATARALRDSILAGSDFGALAAARSADQGSATRGGDLGFIPYSAPLVEPFKSVAFALQNVGDVSDVVDTQFGSHVIKLLEKKGRPSYDVAAPELKTLAARLPRAKAAQDRLSAEIMAIRGATLDTTLLVRTFRGLPVDSILTLFPTGALTPGGLDVPFATVGDSAYTLADLSAFVGTQRVAPGNTPRDQALKVAQPFLNERAIEVEAAQLERNDAEFGRIMREFRDGIVLFRLMEDSVWTAAKRDSLGLLAYYNVNRASYRFQDRTRLLTIESGSDSLLTRISERMARGLTFAALAAEKAATPGFDVRLDTVLVAGATNSVFDRALPLSPGDRVGPLPYRGATTILIVHDGMEPAREKKFDEARAEVETSYQSVIEDRMLTRLRAKYGVRTYPERLVGAFRGPAPMGSAPSASGASR